MELKEFKEKAKGKILDVIANLGSLTLDDLLTDDDIQCAKENAEELLSLINEYIKENDKPKFEVGDYVVYKGTYDTYVTELKNITGQVTFDVWFSKQASELDTQPFILDRTVRHATPEEIAEYKAALNFHEHGRKPFEVKEGDLFKVPSGRKQLIAYPEALTKPDFTHGWELLKTAEELEKWLGADDE